MLGSPQRVRFLLSSGADPNGVSATGFPMLHLAILGESTAVLEALVAARPDLEAPGPTGERPLAVAVRAGNRERARILVTAGADVDGADGFGHTPLRQAVTANDAEMVRILVEAGASPHTVDRLGSTVLAVARDGGNPEILAILETPGSSDAAPCSRVAEPDAARAASAMPRLATQVGHGDEIADVAVSADGRLAITGGWDNAARLWHLPSGRELRALHGHADWVNAVALSFDGALALTGSRDGTALLWDSSTGHRSIRLQHARGDRPIAIVAVALSADGTVALTATADEGVATWDTTACTQQRQLEVPGHVSTAALSPDARFVLAGTEDGTVGIWERATGNRVHAFSAHDGAVSSLTMSPDGKRLLSTSGALGYDSSGDNMAVLWDLESGAAIQRFGPHEEGVLNGLHSAAFVGEDAVLTGDSDGLYLWDTATGKKIAEAVDNLMGFSAAAIAPGARCVLAAGHGVAVLVDVKKAELCAQPLAGATSAITSLRPSRDDRALLAATGFAVAWDLEASREIRRFEVEEEPVGSADWVGDLVATGGSNGPARLWDLVSGGELRQIRRPRSVFSQVSFIPNGDLLLTAGGERFAFTEDLEPVDQDYSLFLWDRDGRQVARFEGDDHPVPSVAFASDPVRLYSAGFMTVREWELPSGRQVGELDFGSPAQPLALAFHPAHGGRLAIGTEELGRIGGPLRMVTLAGERRALDLTGAESSVRAVAFSRDGVVLYAGSDDGLIRRYDARTGLVLGEWVHGAPVTALTAIGNNRLASGAVDGSIVLWDAVRGRELVRLFSFPDGAWLAVDPEGRFDTNDFNGLAGVHWLLPEDRLSPLPLELFTRAYFVPRLLARSLADEELEQTAPIRDLSDLNLAQPVIEIRSIEVSQADPSLATVTVAVEAGFRPRKRPPPHAEDRSQVYDLRVFRDGQLVAAEPRVDGGNDSSSAPEGLAAWRSSRRIDLVDGRATVSLPVRLPTGRGGDTIELSAYAFNEDRVKSETARKPIHLPGTPRRRSGRAYVIVIGVGDNASFPWKLYTSWKRCAPSGEPAHPSSRVQRPFRAGGDSAAHFPPGGRPDRCFPVSGDAAHQGAYPHGLLASLWRWP